MPTGKRGFCWASSRHLGLTWRRQGGALAPSPPVTAGHLAPLGPCFPGTDIHSPLPLLLFLGSHNLSPRRTHIPGPNGGQLAQACPICVFPSPGHHDWFRDRHLIWSEPVKPGSETLTGTSGQTGAVSPGLLGGQKGRLQLLGAGTLPQVEELPGRDANSEHGGQRWREGPSHLSLVLDPARPVGGAISQSPRQYLSFLY